MSLVKNRLNAGVDRFAEAAVRELGDGKVNDAEVVYDRLRTITANLMTLAGLVAASRFLASRALEVVGVLMLITGFIVAKFLEADREEQIRKCRHYLWGLIGAAMPLQVLIRWSTAQGDWGLPNLLGAEIGPFAEGIGGSVLTGMLVFAIMFIPIMYARECFQAWRLLESKRDVQQAISRSGRGRVGRRF